MYFFFSTLAQHQQQKSGVTEWEGRDKESLANDIYLYLVSLFISILRNRLQSAQRTFLFILRAYDSFYCACDNERYSIWIYVHIAGTIFSSSIPNVRRLSDMNNTRSFTVRKSERKPHNGKYAITISTNSTNEKCLCEERMACLLKNDGISCNDASYMIINKSSRSCVCVCVTTV